MSNERVLLKKITEYLNDSKYDELEKLVVENVDNLTPIDVDTLSELPANSDLIRKHGKLYSIYVEKGSKLLAQTGEYTFRSPLRFEVIQNLVKKVENEG